MKKALFYIYGVKELYPEFKKCSVSLEPTFDIVKIDNDDVFFPEKENIFDIDGYLCYAEKNCHGDVVMMIEPISNSLFHNSCEILDIISKNENAFDLSIDFYGKYKFLCNKYFDIPTRYCNLHWNMMRFIKKEAKEFFDAIDN